LFTANLPEPGAEQPIRYAVDVHYLADTLADIDESGRSARPQLALFRNGHEKYIADSPAAFPVPGGMIEAAFGTYGLSRMRLIPEDGAHRALSPHPHSAEGLRARFGRRFPRVSRVIGIMAVVILLVSLAVTVPQILELVSGWDLVAEHIGTFDSPVSLPAWANTTVTVAGVLAATERALTLRNHWLIDLDTTWTTFI
jgi:hypothetical protein